MDQLEEFDIRQYVDALKRRWWVVALAIVVCAVAAGAVSYLQPKVYEATAKVLISAQQDTTGTNNALSDPNQLQNQMQTQVQIAESDAVKADADQQLGGDSAEIIDVVAAGVTNTRVMDITVSSEDPGVAQRAADQYSAAYLRAGADTAINRLSAISESVAERKANLQTQIDTINNQSRVNIPQATLNARAQQVLSLQNQIDQLQTSFDSAQADALVQERSAAPFAVAELPESPVSPQPIRNIALAIVLGLLIGIGIALIWERMDDRVRTGDQMARWFPATAVVATIPRVSGWKNTEEAKNMVMAEPQSTVAEAYRGLRTSLDFMALDQEISVIEVTSATAGEGKSTTVANLATAMAWAGKKVVIVSADLRRPRVHEFFDVKADIGLTDLLIDKTLKLKDALQIAAIDTTAGSVRVLTTGTLPPNPSEVLGSGAVDTVITKLRKEADVVIIDAPPLLPVADPLVLSQYADGVLLVVGAEEVSRKELNRAFDLMDQSLRCDILGIVLNNSGEAASYYSRYGGYEAKGPTAPSEVSISDKAKHVAKSE